MSSPGFLHGGLAAKSPRDEDWGGEPTPTPWDRRLEGDGMPDGNILEWNTEGVVGWIVSLGLGKYQETLLENDIDGEALVHLGHDELKELGVASVGHRLSILKNVYNVKMAHDIPMDPDDYIPVSADEHENNKMATQQDIQRLIEIIRKRDQRIVEAESHIQSLYEAMARLRNDLLPVWRMVKNKNQELPPVSNETPALTPESEPPQDPTPPTSSSLLQAPPTSGKGLSRKFSMKKLILGTPKNASPTYPPPMAEYPYENMQQNAVNNNHNHNNHNNYNNQNNNGLSSQNQPVLPPPADDMRGHPSPTSPGAGAIHHPSYSHHTSLPNMNANPPPTARRTEPMRNPSTAADRDRTTPRTPQYPEDDRGGGSEPDIFKSFRVSMDDPCRKVLPAALKRYNIQADWRLYALYIVHGDQERCLGLEEKPLILFKQLDREGRKPMFMLRRNALGGDPGGNIQVPGGVL